MKQYSVLRRPALSVLGASLLLMPGLAAAGNLGVAGKISTLGYGAEADYVITEKFSVRAQFNTFSYDFDLDENDIEYDSTLDLSSYGVLLDWHPFGGGFRVSAGGFVIDNEIKGKASGQGEYEIGDETYTVGPNDSLQATAAITLGDGFKPYLGFGWGHSPANKGGLLLSFDVGVLFQGSPDVDLKVRGTADLNGTPVDFSNDPTLQAEVREEEKELQDDLKDFDLYPVVSFGIGWRF